MDEREIIRRLSKLDLSHESKVRKKLRERLAARSRQAHLWGRGVRYWAGFTVILMLAIMWTFRLQAPQPFPDIQPQATAYASTGSPAHALSQEEAPTLPAVPRPIPTPNAVFLTTSQLEESTPSMTVSPPVTPEMTQRSGFH